MKSTFILLSILSFSFLFAQEAPEIEWSKNYGGSAIEEGARSVLITEDGGYIVVGSSASNDGDVSQNNGDTDYWIVKFDTEGDIQWEKSYGGSGQDWANSIQQTNDGGFIVAGFSYSNDFDVNQNAGNSDAWIIKLNPQGDLEWQKSYGGSQNDVAIVIDQTSDGGYVFGGSTASNDGDVNGNNGQNDFWIVKLNEIGEIQWQKSLGGSQNEIARDVKRTQDGGYILAGVSDSNDGYVTNNYGQRDVWIIKLDEFGEVEWQKSYGGTNHDRGDYILQTNDGYIFVGSSNSSDFDVVLNNGQSDYWIVKISNSGNIQWEKSFGGSANDLGATLCATQDGGYIILGESDSDDGNVTGNHGGKDYWVIKISSVGNLIWEKSLGGSGNDDWALSVKNTLNNGYIITGRSASNDGDVSGNHGERDFWIVKLGPDQMSTSEISSTQISFYPNPVKDILNFSEKLNDIQIFNLAGQRVLNISDKNSINVNHLNPGTYLLKAKNQKGENIQLKFIKK